MKKFSRGFAALELLLVAIAALAIAYYYMKATNRRTEALAKSVHAIAPNTATTINGSNQELVKTIEKDLAGSAEQREKELEKALMQNQ